MLYSHVQYVLLHSILPCIVCSVTCPLPCTACTVCSVHAMLLCSMLDTMLPCTLHYVTCYASIYGMLKLLQVIYLYSMLCCKLSTHVQYVLMQASYPCRVCSVTSYISMYSKFCCKLFTQVEYVLLQAIYPCTICSVTSYLLMYSTFCYILCIHFQYGHLHAVIPWMEGMYVQYVDDLKHDMVIHIRFPPKFYGRYLGGLFCALEPGTSYLSDQFNIMSAMYVRCMSYQVNHKQWSRAAVCSIHAQLPWLSYITRYSMMAWQCIARYMYCTSLAMISNLS
jgi:hypothetical protein